MTERKRDREREKEKEVHVVICTYYAIPELLLVLALHKPCLATEHIPSRFLEPAAPTNHRYVGTWYSMNMLCSFRDLEEPI